MSGWPFPLRSTTSTGGSYHAVASDIAEAVLSEPGVDKFTATLVSRIGRPVTRPQLVHVATVEDIDRRCVGEIAATRRADWRGERDRLLAGGYLLY